LFTVLERWTRAVLRQRVPVLAAWLVLLAAGAWASTRLGPLLANDLAVPGTESAQAQQLLKRAFGERTDGDFTVVFRVRDPGDRALRARLLRRLALAARVIPGAHAGIALLPGGGILYGSISSGLDLAHAKRYTGPLRAALRAQRGPPALVTGQPAIQHDLDPIFSSDLRHGEAIALPFALVILLAVLGVSLAALVPFLFAACTIGTTLAIVYGLAHAFSMVTYVTNLVELLGVGLAIDYSLLVVYRFREEAGDGRASEDAIVRTVLTAGRTAVLSGLTVAAGLALLLLVPVPFIRSMGIAGLLIPLVSILATLTLQPALLSILGPRGVRPLAGPLFRPPGTVELERSRWARLARLVMRRPVLTLAAGVVALGLVALPALRLDLAPGSLKSVPSSPEAMRAVALVSRAAGRGAATPIFVTVDTRAAGGTRRPVYQAAFARLAATLAADVEVRVVARGSRAPYVDPSGRYARIVVLGRHAHSDEATQELVRRIRRLAHRAGFPADAAVATGGTPAQGVDFISRTFGPFPWLVLAALALTFAVLMRAFRSLLLPLKAILLNLLTVSAVYGLLVAVFRYGVAAGPLGVERSSQIEAWIPIFLFATLFGLSMDYEVFLVMRMREAWDDLGDNARAVAYGLDRTGPIVTAAALIMVAAFSGFVAGRVGALQQFGLGLALAVLIDATLVRAALVPAAMAIFGRWNWWLPARAARLVGATPSPLTGNGGRGVRPAPR
jgi:RND superfamily putative drug exporter